MSCIFTFKFVPSSFFPTALLIFTLSFFAIVLINSIYPVESINITDDATNNAETWPILDIIKGTSTVHRVLIKYIFIYLIHTYIPK